MFERRARNQSQAEYARKQASRQVSVEAQWQKEAETWFDGSPDSVDRRLAACEKMLHQARTRLAHDGFTKGARHLETIASLEVDKGALLELRRTLLTAASDREAAGKHRVEDFRGPITPGDDPGIARNPYTGDTETGRFIGDPEGRGHWDKDDRTHFGHLSPQDRRFVELESAKFVANNPGLPLDELTTRARNHVELRTSNRDTIKAFVGKVASLHRPAPRVASAPTTIPDFPAEAMYL